MITVDCLSRHDINQLALIAFTEVQILNGDILSLSANCQNVVCWSYTVCHFEFVGANSIALRRTILPMPRCQRSANSHVLYKVCQDQRPTKEHRLQRNIVRARCKQMSQTLKQTVRWMSRWIDDPCHWNDIKAMRKEKNYNDAKVLSHRLQCKCAMCNVLYFSV